VWRDGQNIIGFAARVLWRLAFMEGRECASADENSCYAYANEANPRARMWAETRAAATACTIYAVPHTMIDVHRSYVPFWLHGVAGADLRPDNSELNVTIEASLLETMLNCYLHDGVGVVRTKGYSTRKLHIATIGLSTKLSRTLPPARRSKCRA
jgi:hypothetical protein